MTPRPHEPILIFHRSAVAHAFAFQNILNRYPDGRRHELHFLDFVFLFVTEVQPHRISSPGINVSAAVILNDRRIQRLLILLELILSLYAERNQRVGTFVGPWFRSTLSVCTCFYMFVNIPSAFLEAYSLVSASTPGESK